MVISNYKVAKIFDFIIAKIIRCQRVLDSIVVSFPGSHAGYRGSIPRRGGCTLNSEFFKYMKIVRDRNL